MYAKVKNTAAYKLERIGSPTDERYAWLSTHYPGKISHIHVLSRNQFNQCRIAMLDHRCDRFDYEILVKKFKQQKNEIENR